MRRRAGVILALALLLVPVGSAEDARGVFTVQGPVSFPSGTQMAGPTFGLFVGNVSPVAFRAEAARATVFEFTTTFQTVSTPLASPALSVQTNNRSWPVRDVVVTFLDGWESDGYLGVQAGPSSHLIAAGGAVAEARGRSAVGGGPGASSDPASQPTFRQEATWPHLHVAGAGLVEMTGAVALKTRGPLVEIRSADNVTTHATGTTDEEIAGRRMTWLYVRFDSPATVAFQAHFETLTGEVRAESVGTLRFATSEGALRTDGGTYVAEGGATELDGAFSAALTPLAPSAARLDLSGEVRSSSLPFVEAPGALEAVGGAPWTTLLLVGGVMAGAAGSLAGGWTLLRRSRPAHAPPDPFPPFTVEDCVDAAGQAMAAEEYAEALEWWLRAHALAPTSERVTADLAFCLASLGRVDEAMRWFETAHALGEDGESAYNAARAARAARLPRAEVLRWLEAALDRSPEHVEEMREEFADLTRDPAWRAMERRAWERLGREPLPDDEEGPR